MSEAPPSFEVRRDGDVFVAGRDGAPVGELRVLTRPDSRRLALFSPEHPASWSAMVAEASQRLDVDLYAEVDAAEVAELEWLDGAGFVLSRREDLYEIPTDWAALGLRRLPPPDTVDLVSAADCDLDRLRHLDEKLRDDVPGSAGWRWRREDFLAETFGADFDRDTYLAAVERSTGEHVGLAASGWVVSRHGSAWSGCCLRTGAPGSRTPSCCAFSRSCTTVVTGSCAPRSPTPTARLEAFSARERTSSGSGRRSSSSTVEPVPSAIQEVIRHNGFRTATLITWRRSTLAC